MPVLAGPFWSRAESEKQPQPGTVEMTPPADYYSRLVREAGRREQPQAVGEADLRPAVTRGRHGRPPKLAAATTTTTASAATAAATTATAAANTSSNSTANTTGDHRRCLRFRCPSASNIATNAYTPVAPPPPFPLGPTSAPAEKNELCPFL